MANLNDLGPRSVTGTVPTSVIVLILSLLIYTKSVYEPRNLVYIIILRGRSDDTHGYLQVIPYYVILCV